MMEVLKKEEPLVKAAQVLRKQAQKAKSLRLAALASEIMTRGHVDVVASQVDKMMEVLKKEEKEDLETKDWCKAETFKNEQEASKYEYKVTKLGAKVSKLEDKIIAMEATVKE